MWITGTWRLRNCIGHDATEVEGTGDTVNYCEVVTAVLEEGKMEIMICAPGEPPARFVFMVGNTEESTRSGQDNNNQMALGKHTDSSMVIDVGAVFDFDGLQMTMRWGPDYEPFILDLEEV